MVTRSVPVAVALATAVPWLGAGFVHAQAPSEVRALPLTETRYALGDQISAYRDFMRSGGPPPDGIPSIDSPRFIRADEAQLAPEDMVIGILLNGEARAYPQAIMVHHEIVNDRVGGTNVAVTYCPLTATAQGFLRGNSALGVSGQLLNSNLVMYDRDSGSYISQIAATGLSGPYEGRGLTEVGLVWTTWERWRSAHPDTQVLSDRTGYLRNYSRDPYGSYNPPDGYYVEDGTVFPVMHRSVRLHAKEMVVGARTSSGSAYFVLRDLASARVLGTPSFIAVYDRALHTAHIYERSGADLPVALPNGAVRMGDEEFAPDSLPLNRTVAVQAFFFAWHAFFPDSETP
ncbi:MAG: DUF3179 domain-containing protein [Gemmatimonadota bacterium]